MRILFSRGSPKRCFLRLRANAVYMVVFCSASGKLFQANTQEYIKYSLAVSLGGRGSTNFFRFRSLRTKYFDKTFGAISFVTFHMKIAFL